MDKEMSETQDVNRDVLRLEESHRRLQRLVAELLGKNELLRQQVACRAAMETAGVKRETA